MCGESSLITTEKYVSENHYLPINKAVVSGSLFVGRYQVCYKQH